MDTPKGIYTSSQIDRMFKLEQGCCLEACECGWIPATQNEKGEWIVDAKDAHERWVLKARPNYSARG